MSLRSPLVGALAVFALVAAMSQPLARAQTAATAARFSLVVDGVEIAQFAEAPDLDQAAALKKLPGKRKPPTLTLKRGKNQSMEMLAWHAPKDATLVMYNVDGTPVARYHLEQAWPSKLEVGALAAGTSDVAIDSVTLVCASIEPVATAP
jgi:hypothetical protein